MEQTAFNRGRLSIIIIILIISTNLHTALSFQRSLCSTDEDATSLYDNTQLFYEDQQSFAVCDPAKGKKQCSLDCRTLLFCNGADVLGTTLCPNNLPNCDPATGSCVVGPVQGCIGKDSSLCPSAKGYFPHPTDCTLYNYCSHHGVIHSYWCPRGSVFDMYQNKCVRGGLCGFIDCSNDKLFAYHTVYREMYALCENGRMIPGSYEECVKASHFFDYENFSCVAVCLRPGNIPHEYDDTKYYRCTRSGPSFNKTPINCPTGYNFNEDSETCKPSPNYVSPLQKIINSVLPVLPDFCHVGPFS